MGRKPGSGLYYTEKGTTMKATVLVLAIAACYYTAAALEQAPITYTCGDDTGCYQQCIEFGEDNCE